MLRIRRLALASMLGLALLAAVSGCGGGQGETPSATTVSLTYDRHAALDVRAGRLTRIPADPPTTPVGLKVTSFTYESDGRRVPAIMATPVGRRPTGCLIWETGLISKREDSRIAWVRAASLGLTTFSIDLRDRGEGAAARDSPAAALEDPAQVRDIVHGSAIDLRRGIDYLDGLPQCHHTIGLVGGGLGGMIGSLVAASSGVKAVALLSVSGTWQALLQTTDLILPGIEKDNAKFDAALTLLRPYDPDQWVGRISPRPLLLTHGDRDDVVSDDAFADLAAAALQPVSVQTYPGGHDPFVPPDVTAEVGVSNALALLDFMRRQLTRVSRVSGD